MTGAVLALMLLVAVPALAEKDAAMKAREGEINHWIEYYRKDREPAPASAATRNGVTADGERECKKEETEKSEVQK